MKIKTDRRKINLLMARKQLNVVNLAENYGASRARMNVILNSRELTPMCVGKLAAALGVDVSEILED